MTPEVFDIYNKHLINLVNDMFEDLDIKDFLTPEAKKRLLRDGRLVSRHNNLNRSYHKISIDDFNIKAKTTEYPGYSVVLYCLPALGEGAVGYYL